MLTLEQAIKETNARVSKAVEMRKLQRFKAAAQQLMPLAEAFATYDPPGKDGPKTFQDPIEKDVHMILSREKEDPRTLPVHVNLVFYFLGVLSLDMEDPVAATEALGKAIDYNPATPLALFELSECFKAVGDWKGFERMTRNSFSVDVRAGQLARSYRNMAYLMSEKKQYEDSAALSHLSLMYEKNPAAMYELAYLAKETGKMFPEPDAKAYAAACERLGIPFGPAPHVRGLLRGKIQGFNMFGHPELAKRYESLMQELHPGVEMKLLMRTPKEGETTDYFGSSPLWGSEAT